MREIRIENIGTQIRSQRSPNRCSEIRRITNVINTGK
jgi:hypothetical protein